MNNKITAFAVFLMGIYTVFAQYNVSGVVVSELKTPLNNVEIYNSNGRLLAKTNAEGFYSFITQKKELQLSYYITGYHFYETKVQLTSDRKISVTLQSFSEELSEVEITAIRKKAFALKHLNEVEGTAIYSGKKTEVVLIDEVVGNKAANSARQIYAQVVGLNIYENDDAGLQLNIGGRGLDPNRTSNLNTRQNGYDISADVLGYPESYYTPPADALQEIQVVRGAAALQYGTQFGGLINFEFKKPNRNKKIEILTRQSLGSYGLFNSFNSVTGTVNNTGYYTYANYKRGDGFRPNSNFESINAFAHVKHDFSAKTSLTVEATYLNYLAKQAGGLTDTQFKKDIFYSNRSRNWFRVNWKLWALKFKHDFSDNTKFTFNVFGLNATRKALGYRTVPIHKVDPIEDGVYTENRNLIVGAYNNWGVEGRFLSKYSINNTKQTYLLGFKYYDANNSEKQGTGFKGSDANFNYVVNENDLTSNFTFPNRNVAFFGEHIFKINDKISITPGFRYEFIKTEGKGNYIKILTDGAGNPLPGGTLRFKDDRIKDRNFGLLGIGFSYKPSKVLEIYANASQNYRSVTFTDIRTVSPTFVVDEDIDDEKGATFDMGFRGRYKNILKYDIGAFGLMYNQRIGVILASEGINKGDRMRTNIGDALIYGFEGFADVNLASLFRFNNSKLMLRYFTNLALTKSEYTSSKKVGVVGNQVEFIPNVNLKTGLRFGYRNFLTSLQFTHLSNQFTDATNADIDEYREDREGTIGPIPAYSIVDFSMSYTYKKWKLETGVNNLLDEKYFTRRATGYPGPGIIPSSPRSWYLTLQFKY